MAATPSISKFLDDIRWPILVAMMLIVLSIANSHFGWSARPPAAINISHLILRVFLASLAGYLALYRVARPIWTSAIAGGLVFVGENLVSATWFILLQSWVNVGHVAKAVAFYVWVPMVIGLIGGLLGQVRRRQANAAI